MGMCTWLLVKCRNSRRIRKQVYSRTPLSGWLGTRTPLLKGVIPLVPHEYNPPTINACCKKQKTLLRLGVRQSYIHVLTRPVSAATSIAMINLPWAAISTTLDFLSVSYILMMPSENPAMTRLFQ